MVFNKALIALIVGFILISVINIFTQEDEPICGNRIIEKGETKDTCCEDDGCLEEQVCQHHKCVELTKPVELTCSKCQYLENNLCKHYVCCSDYDCNDNDLETRDKCSNPQSLYATCKNIPLNCDKKEYGMAFVIVSTEDTRVSQKQIDLLNKIKSRFSTAFEDATNGERSMNTSYTIFLMQVDENMTDGYNMSILSEWSIKFYRDNPDIFDFISFYSIFDSPVPYIHHATVNNYIDGIGYGTIDVDDISNYFGSRKLLGVNYMGKIEELLPPLLTEEQVLIANANALLHETGHQWCCYVGSDFGTKNVSELEIIQGVHFYIGLYCPYEEGCAMGSAHWIENENGTFDISTGLINKTKKYHPFQLYFMGVLPKTEYSTQFPVYDAGIVGQNYSLKNARFYKTTRINDIISVEGERKCF